MKYLKKFQEQLENHDETELMNYKEAIRLYSDGIDMLNKSVGLFINSPWGIPEEFQNILGDGGQTQGDENLYLLEKESKYLLELKDGDLENQ